MSSSHVTNRIIAPLCVAPRAASGGASRRGLPAAACPARAARGPLAAKAGRASPGGSARAHRRWRRLGRRLGGGRNRVVKVRRRQHDDGDDLRRKFHVLMLCNRHPLPPLAPVTDVNGPGFGFWAAQRPGFWVLGCAAARVLGFGVGPKISTGGPQLGCSPRVCTVGPRARPWLALTTAARANQLRTAKLWRACLRPQPCSSADCLKANLKSHADISRARIVDARPVSCLPLPAHARSLCSA